MAGNSWVRTLPADASVAQLYAPFDVHALRMDNGTDVVAVVTDTQDNVYSCQPGQSIVQNMRVSSFSMPGRLTRASTFGQCIVTLYDETQQETGGGSGVGTSGRGNFYDRLRSEIRLVGDGAITQNNSTVTLDSYTTPIGVVSYIASIYLRLYRLLGSTNRRTNRLAVYLYNIGSGQDVRLEEAISLPGMMVAPFSGPLYNIVAKGTDYGYLRQGYRIDVRTSDDGTHNNFRYDYNVRIMEADA